MMANLLHAAAAPVTLVAIGPLTNIALLLAAHPRVKPRINRIVICGHGLTRGAVVAADGHGTERHFARGALDAICHQSTR